MRITYENRNIIEQMQIHDSEFNGFAYDYEHRQITMSCNNIFLKRSYILVFENVVLMHLQSCSFWHGGNSIMWINVIEDNEHLCDLYHIQNSNPELYCGSQLDKGINYITMELTINSGDTLLISCESLNYLESYST